MTRLPNGGLSLDRRIKSAEDDPGEGIRVNLANWRISTKHSMSKYTPLDTD